MKVKFYLYLLISLTMFACSTHSDEGLNTVEEEAFFSIKKFLLPKKAALQQFISHDWVKVLTRL